MASQDDMHIQSDTESLKVIGKTLLYDSDFCDVTLVCADNQHLPAHRAVLCTGSNFLRELLYDSQHQKTFLYLGKVQLTDLKPLLEFLYLGNCTVQKSRLGIVDALANDLGISGFPKNLKQTYIKHCSEENDVELQENENIEIITTMAESLEHINKNIGFREIPTNYRNYTDNKVPAEESPQIDSFCNINKQDIVVKTQDAELQTNKEQYSIDQMTGNTVNEHKQELSSFILGGGNASETNLINNKTLNTLVELSTKRKVGMKYFKLPKTEVSDPDINGIYNCEKCKYSSKSIHNFRRHKLTKHEGFSYPCEQCSNNFRNREILIQHVESVHEGLNFKCDECDGQFNKKKIISHRAKMRKCEQCPFFSCPKQITTHFNQIHNIYYINGTYKCDECMYQSIKQKSVLLHKRVFHGNKLFPCPHCDFTTKFKSNLNLHTDEKHLVTEYKCEKCDFKSIKSKMWAHKIKNHEHRRYSCKYCEYVGMTYSKLEHHRQKRHLQVDYTCKVCNVKFVTRGGYRRHMRHQHESKPMSCDQCSYVGKTNIYLDIHVQSNHSETYLNCAQCNYKTKNRNTLRAHIKSIHEGFTHNCEKCGTKMNHPKSIKRHKLTCGSQTYFHQQVLNDTKVVTKNKIVKSLEENKPKKYTQELIPSKYMETIPLACDSKECCRT